MLAEGVLNNQCRPFREIYKDGKALCENMWNNAFRYEANASKPAYSMWHFEDKNPNDQVTKALGLPQLNTVTLGGDFWNARKEFFARGFAPQAPEQETERGDRQERKGMDVMEEQRRTESCSFRTSKPRSGFFIPPPSSAKLTTCTKTLPLPSPSASATRGRSRPVARRKRSRILKRSSTFTGRSTAGTAVDHFLRPANVFSVTRHVHAHAQPYIVVLRAPRKKRGKKVEFTYFPGSPSGPRFERNTRACTHAHILCILLTFI